MTNPKMFPPPGYYRVNEAYDLLLEKCFQRQLWGVELDETREQCVRWLEQHREAVRVFAKDGQLFEVPSDAWDRTWHPDMLLVHDSIPMGGSPFAEYTGCILIVERKPFDDWIELVSANVEPGHHIDLLKEPIWGVLPVLVWIATRDMEMANRAAAPQNFGFKESVNLAAKLAHAKQIGKNLNWPCQGLEDAWKNHLVKKLEASELHYFVNGEKDKPLVNPNEDIFKQPWFAWDRPLFIREAVLDIWPVTPTTEKPSKPILTLPSKKPPIQKSSEKPLLGSDVIKDWAGRHMRANKARPTSYKTEMKLIAAEYPEYRLPGKGTYISLRKVAAKASRMESWCRRGPKTVAPADDETASAVNLAENGRAKLLDELRDKIKISTKKQGLAS